VNAERFGCHTPVCAAQVQTTRDYSTKKLDLRRKTPRAKAEP
jgi:hypothetical protein